MENIKIFHYYSGHQIPKVRHSREPRIGVRHNIFAMFFCHFNKMSIEK